MYTTTLEHILTNNGGFGVISTTRRLWTNGNLFNSNFTLSTIHNLDP